MVMQMDDVNELKDILGKVERKMVAAGKIYGAMNFAFWLVAMLGYYILGSFVSYGLVFSIIYWPVAFGISVVFGIKISRLISKVEGKTGSSKGFGTCIGASWGAGAVIGWFAIPSMNLDVNSTVSLSLGFLSFIAISVFGMWLTFEFYKIKSREMLPSFLFPAIGIPVATMMKNNAMLWAGFLVAMGFSLTILWYTYSAFRTIGGLHAEENNKE